MIPFARLVVAGVCLAAAAPIVALQAAPKKQAQQPFPELSPRSSSRIFYWGGNSSGGEVLVDYAQPVWKEEYDKQVDAMLGVRWRLGSNFWTRLDTNMDLAAGETDIPTGDYYLVLERKKEDKSFVLWLLDPVEVRDAKLDAFQAPQTTGGIAVPMDYKRVDVKAEKLMIRLDLDAKRKDGANFVVHFGNHELTAKLQMHPKRD